MQLSPIHINPVKTDAVSQNGQQQSPFHNVREGQVVKADVVDAKGSSLTLQLADGTTVKAEFPGAQVMLPGDKLELTMTSKTDGSIHLRLTSVNGQPVHAGTGELQVRLMDMGVQPSEINTNAAQFLADRNIQPTPERITLLTKIATHFPELPASVALFMAANNIPATQQNVNTLMMWLQNGQNMDGEVQQLVDQVTQMLMEQTGMQSPAPEGQVAGNAAMQTAGEQTVQPEQAQMSDARAALAAAIAQLTGEPVAETQTQATAPQQPGNTLQPNIPVFVESFLTQVQAQGQGTALENVPQSALADFAATLATMSEGEAQQAIEGFLSKFPMTQEQQTQAAQVLQNVFSEARQIAAPETTTQQQMPAVTGEVAQQQSGAVADAGEKISTQQPAVQENTTGTVQNQPGNTQQQAGNAAQPQEAAVKQELQQVMQSLTKLVVNMRRDVATDAEFIQDALKNQQKIADSVQSGIARAVGENNPATQRATDLATRVQMGTQLENFYYCQLPFVINQNQNTAELYVFERKHKGGEDDSVNTTILIALDTENMGRVETVMRAERDDLSLEFRVENKTVQTYLEETVQDLSEQLKNEEFHVTGIRVVQIETRATPLNVDQVIGEKEHFQLQAVDISV